MPPSATFVREQVKNCWPAAVRLIEERKLNEFFTEDADGVGVFVQGGTYNTLLSARPNAWAWPTCAAIRRCRFT